MSQRFREIDTPAEATLEDAVGGAKAPSRCLPLAVRPDLITCERNIHGMLQQADQTLIRAAGKGMLCRPWTMTERLRSLRGRHGGGK